MKMVLLVCNSYFMDRVMQILKDNGIDYFTSWDKAKGKGHGTEPHLGSGGFASTNSVTMVALEDDAPLEGLGVTYEEIRYEGYAPGGVAVMVDCLTDNRNRTVAEVRHAFSKHDGNLGTDGSVGYLFSKVGILNFEPGAGGEAPGHRPRNRRR